MLCCRDRRSGFSARLLDISFTAPPTFCLTLHSLSSRELVAECRRPFLPLLALVHRFDRVPHSLKPRPREASNHASASELQTHSLELERQKAV